MCKKTLRTLRGSLNLNGFMQGMMLSPMFDHVYSAKFLLSLKPIQGESQQREACGLGSQYPRPACLQTNR